jgi:hypothetical protein
VDAHLHLPRRGLDLDLVGRDQFRLELTPPLDGALDALARIIKFPLGGTQVARARVWFVEPAALPGCIRITVGKVKRVSVLYDKRGETSVKRPVSVMWKRLKADLAQTLNLLQLIVVVLIDWLHDGPRCRTCEHLGGGGLGH